MYGYNEQEFKNGHSQEQKDETQDPFAALFLQGFRQQKLYYKCSRQEKTSHKQSQSERITETEKDQGDEDYRQYPVRECYENVDRGGFDIARGGFNMAFLRGSA